MNGYFFSLSLPVLPPPRLERIVIVRCRRHNTTGVLDAKARPARADHRHAYVHQRSAVRGAAQRRHRRLGPAHSVRAAARLRHLRVPGEHRAQDESGRAAARHR